MYAQTYSLLFYLKKSKGNRETSAIYIRLTVAGKRKEFSTGKTIKNKEWNKKACKVIGSSSNSKSINLFLESVRTRIFDAYTSLFNSGKTITSESIKNRFLGTDVINKTLVEVFTEHNNHIEALIGNGYAKGTWERYETSLKHIKQFMILKYNFLDIAVKDISPSFISNYDFFLRTVRKCSNNSTVKYLMNLHKIINICLDNE
ncbi:phage integrase SAM-like domain and Arm DNA-binding domain-containing protein [Chryseobacterium sp.]|uniref:phage integrase SAM-like domain and Arm DNA-binding domain-containing protein n=1 Tax=Chryseobacterium sp. TaxID=1871047 RepID=UPI003916EE76